MFYPEYLVRTSRLQHNKDKQKISTAYIQQANLISKMNFLMNKSRIRAGVSGGTTRFKLIAPTLRMMLKKRDWSKNKKDTERLQRKKIISKMS